MSNTDIKQEPIIPCAPELGKATPASQAPKAAETYPAGYYVCDHYLQVVKKLTTENKVNKDGTIARTHGTWTNKNNFYIFRANEKALLNEEDMKHHSIQDLIARGVLRRTL